MNVQARTTRDVCVLELQGDLTLGKGDVVLRDEVQRLLEQGTCKVVLNLAAVEHIDSAGLGEVVACKKRLGDHGGDLKVLRPRQRVLEPFLRSRLAEVLELYEDESRAVDSF